jgi:hypothetical protein
MSLREQIIINPASRSANGEEVNPSNKRELYR